MNSQALIRIVGVSHTYPGKGKTPPRQALKEIDLDIQSGEMIALLGPNGSGKSTLLRILTTALRAERGTVEIGGHDLLKEPRAVRRQLGVVFQKPALESSRRTGRFAKWTSGVSGSFPASREIAVDHPLE